MWSNDIKMYKASAPGSLMLLGEYAVLHGKHALVCAVDKRITVFLSPRTDKKIAISSRLGKFSCDISSNIVSEPPFQFVLTVIKRFQPLLKTGCDITIESEFSHEVGFGSSAAVTVATMAVFAKWLDKNLDNLQFIDEARSVIQAVQGLGSGADVAACVLGGIVAYQMEPLQAERLPNVFPMTVVFSGSKTPTVEAVKQVNDSFSRRPEKFQQICQQIEKCVLAGIDYVSEKKWNDFGNIMNTQQESLDQLGVNTPELADIINKLRQQSSILGAKISGSGLGDCVVALGNLNGLVTFEDPKIKVLSTSISMRGVECEQD